MDESKVLIFDIESAGVNALKSDLGFVILFGYKWLGEKDAHIIQASRRCLRQFSDRALLTKAAHLFEEAEIIVAHFGSIFDRRFIQGRLLINGLSPIPPTKMRDTCMIARSVANFSSNRLKHLAKILDLRHQKLENNWPTAWFKVMQGDMAALDGMAEYCKGDVQALEELYLRLRPFDNNHPRLVNEKHDADGRTLCGICGSPVQYRGFALLTHHRYRRFKCKSCGRWDREHRAV